LGADDKEISLEILVGLIGSVLFSLPSEERGMTGGRGAPFAATGSWEAYFSKKEGMNSVASSTVGTINTDHHLRVSYF
jgi:hypothetical protein